MPPSGEGALFAEVDGSSSRLLHEGGGTRSATLVPRSKHDLQQHGSTPSPILPRDIIPRLASVVGLRLSIQMPPQDFQARAFWQQPFANEQAPLR